MPYTFSLAHRATAGRTTAQRVTAGLTIAALSFGLAGCSNNTPEQPAAKPEANTQSSTQPDTQLGTQSTVTITDTWAKATDPGATLDEAMSGVFGELKNGGKQDVTITGVWSDTAEMAELHEVVGGTMRPIKGDVVIPAGGSYKLEPGANHIMLMMLKSELVPGDEVRIKLSFSDGSELAFSALVKDTSGANESYAPDGDA